MTRMRIALLTVLGACTALVCGTALAYDPLDLYVGAAFGQSNVRLGEGEPSFDQNQSAWKLMAGMRPIAPLGAEFEYINFGHPSFNYFQSGTSTSLDKQDRAATLMGLAYLPLPLPLLDIYGKAGFARLQQTGNGVSCTSGGASCVSLFQLSRNDTRFAYGAGMQAKFESLAVRVEYERINAVAGDPDLLSVGLTWTF